MSKCSRKQYESEETWKDRSASRHKHQFEIKCLLEVRIPAVSGRVDDYQIMYFSSLMCSKCHTFTYAKSLVKDRFFTYTSCLREKRKSSLYSNILTIIHNNHLIKQISKASEST